MDYFNLLLDGGLGDINWESLITPSATAATAVTPKATFASVRDKEQADLEASKTSTSKVDERTQARAKLGLPPTQTKKVEPAPAPSFVDPQDVRDPVTGLTPAQTAAKKALDEAVSVGAALGIKTKTNAATPGNVPTVTVTGFPYKGKTVVSRVDNRDGTFTVTYSDGTSEITGTKIITSRTTTQPSTTDTTLTSQITTNVDVLKSMLRGMGFNSAIIDSSTSFLLSLLKDGLDYDNAVAIFLNSRDYTLKNGNKIESPFYAQYGFYNEGLARPKSPAELYNAVEGYKEVADLYKLSSKFTSADYIKNYIKNNVTVAKFAENANMARLKGINADPAYLEALKQLDFIKEGADLTDFFMDPKIGQEKLEQNRATAAFSAEAIRRAGSGITFSGQRFGQTTAGLMALGLSEAQIGVQAAQGFENIAQNLAPTVKLEQIYNREAPATAETIQKELEAQEFQGTASQRRRLLAERETRAFQGKAGVGRFSLGTYRQGLL